MFNKCNFPYKWVESKLGCLKIVMFTKLANYLQRVEVINFKITIDARHALLETAHHPGRHGAVQMYRMHSIGHLEPVRRYYWLIRDKLGGTPHHKRLDK